jgi:hypothetical protein
MAILLSVRNFKDAIHRVILMRRFWKILRMLFAFT